MFGFFCILNAFFPKNVLNSNILFRTSDRCFRLEISYHEFGRSGRKRKGWSSFVFMLIVRMCEFRNVNVFPCELMESENLHLYFPWERTETKKTETVLIIQVSFVFTHYFSVEEVLNSV